MSLPGGRTVGPRGHREHSIINMVEHINSDKIVARTSPTIKRSRLTQVFSATSQPVLIYEFGLRLRYHDRNYCIYDKD